jgi:hypothetical protein
VAGVIFAREENVSVSTIAIDDLRDARAALEAVLLSPADRDTFDLTRAVDGVAEAIGPEAAAQLLDREPGLWNVRPNFRSEFNEYISRMEAVETKKLLATDIPAPVSFRAFATPNALGMFTRLEALAAHVTRPGMRRIVMVGCGWRPVTMFYLHEATDAQEIIGLDVIPDAVETSATLARKLGYGRMRTTLCDGASFDYAGADLVYVASMVSGKREVIARILETAPANVRLALWEPISLGRLWLESSEPEGISELEIIGRGPVVRQSQDIFARRRPA